MRAHSAARHFQFDDGDLADVRYPPEQTAMAPDDRPTVIQFGSFEADLRSGELRKSGVKVRLPNQPFQVLAMLLTHPGEVVTRDQFKQHLWPADTFVDFEHGLNKAINRLRETVGDSADEPRFIETLPKRGYRFIAAIESSSATTPAHAPSAQDGDRTARRRSRRLSWPPHSSPRSRSQ